VINIYLLLFYVQTILSDVLLTESSMCGSVTFRPSVKPTFHLLNEINSLFQKKALWMPLVGSVLRNVGNSLAAWLQE
jgi:hypothetical protein